MHAPQVVVLAFQPQYVNIRKTSGRSDHDLLWHVHVLDLVASRVVEKFVMQLRQAL